MVQLGRPTEHADGAVVPESRRQITVTGQLTQGLDTTDSGASQVELKPNAPTSAVGHVVRTLGGKWVADEPGDSWVAEFEYAADRNSARLLIGMLHGWQSAPFHAGSAPGLRVWEVQ